MAESTEEVADVVRLCAEHGVPVIPYGVGSSVEGHVLATRGGISLDLSGMNRVLAIHAGMAMPSCRPASPANS